MEMLLQVVLTTVLVLSILLVLGFVFARWVRVAALPVSPRWIYLAAALISLVVTVSSFIAFAPVSFPWYSVEEPLPLSLPLVVSSHHSIGSIPEFVPMGVFLGNIRILATWFRISHLQDPAYLSRFSRPLVAFYTFAPVVAIFLLNLSALILGLKASSRLRRSNKGSTIQTDTVKRDLGISYQL
jgi:hypothetical protein